MSQAAAENQGIISSPQVQVQWQVSNSIPFYKTWSFSSCPRQGCGIDFSHLRTPSTSGFSASGRSSDLCKSKSTLINTKANQSMEYCSAPYSERFHGRLSINTSKHTTASLLTWLTSSSSRSEAVSGSQAPPRKLQRTTRSFTTLPGKRLPAKIVPSVLISSFLG